MSIRPRCSSTLAAAGLFLLLGAAHLMAETYYVATTGDDANDGLSEANAWRTVTYGATRTKSGDTVYIKAGRYDGENVEINSSGVAGAPIVFEGYRSFPGDKPTLDYAPGDTLDPTVLPVLAGLDEAAAGVHPVIYLVWNVRHIVIRNLGVTSGDYGVFAQMSDHIAVEDVYSVRHWAHGLFFRDCSEVSFRRCVSVDASMCNIILERTRDSVVENCKSYAVGYEVGDESTDYHIVLMDAQNNVVRDCQAFNMHSFQGGHAGHGIGIKDFADEHAYPYPHSTNNQILNCATHNMGEYLFVAHEAYGNVFENCTAVGQFRDQAFWSEGINIRDGAHDNTFRGCRIVGIRTSLAFQDTSEGPTNLDDSYKLQIAQGNILVNCVFADSEVGVQLWNADYNLIKNCVFDGVQALLVDFRTILVNRTNPGNRCWNSIVANVAGGYQGDWGSGDRMAFTYSDFWGNSFPLPTGVGNLGMDPLFADPVQRDYHLMSAQGRWDSARSAWVKDGVTSPCIDAGDPVDDWSGEPSPNGSRINIGAYGGAGEASLGSGSALPWGSNAGLDLVLSRADESMVLRVKRAQIGDTLAIQTSPDLIDWTTVETRTVDEVVETFNDKDASGLPRRFYRVVRTHLP